MKAPALRPVRRTTPGDAPQALVVACVWWGDKYSFEYVDNLAHACSRYIPHHQFHVLTDRTPEDEEWWKLKRMGLTPRPLRTDRDGWWQKLQLFKPGQFLPGDRVLYFDLDVVLLGDLTHLVSVQDDFVIAENFGPNRSQAAYNSSVMLWKVGGTEERIWSEFKDEYMKKLHGDQCWIWRCLDPYDAVYPVACWPREWVISYKYDIRAGRRGPLIVFHGDPKPPQTEWRAAWGGTVGKNL